MTRKERELLEVISVKDKSGQVFALVGSGEKLAEVDPGLRNFDTGIVYDESRGPKLKAELTRGVARAILDVLAVVRRRGETFEMA